MSSPGILLGWNREEATACHTASVTPAGALSCRSHSAVCVCIRAARKKRYSGLRACSTCALVCHRARSRAEYGSQESCHRRGGSHGRSPFFLSNTHTHTSSEMAVACRPAHVFFRHLIHSFSIRLIYTAWGLEEQCTAGFKRRRSNVLTFHPRPLFSNQPPPADRQTRAKTRPLLMFTLQLILVLFLFRYLVFLTS